MSNSTITRAILMSAVLGGSALPPLHAMGSSIQRVTEAACSQIHPSRREFDTFMNARAVAALINAVDPGKFYYTQTDFDECVSLARSGVDQRHRALQTCLLLVSQRSEQLSRHAESRLAVNDVAKIGGPSKSPLGWGALPRNEAELKARWDIVIDDQAAVAALYQSDRQQAVKYVTTRMQKRASDLKALAHDAACELYMTSIVRAFDPKGFYVNPKSMVTGSGSPILGRPGVYFRSQFGTPEISGFDLWWLSHSSSVPTLGARVLNVDVGSSKMFETSLPDALECNKLLAMIRNAKTIRLTIVSPKTGEVELENLIPFTGPPATVPAACFRINRKSIGYVRLDVLPTSEQGAPSIGEMVVSIFKSFEKRNAGGVVLDLRNCYSFDSRQADILAGVLLGSEPYSQVLNAEKESTVRKGNGDYMYKGPLIIIANRGTRGAAEMIIAACVDRSRAVLVGETTAGEVGQRAIFQLDDFLKVKTPPQASLGAVCVAHAYDFRLDGKQVQGIGVAPHITVEDIAHPAVRSELEDLRLPSAEKVSVAKHLCFLSGELLEKVKRLPTPTEYPAFTLEADIEKWSRPVEIDRTIMRSVNLCQYLSGETSQ